MNQVKNCVQLAAKSPWLDSKYGNLFRDQFRLIDDLTFDPWLKSAGTYFTPIEIYQWIHEQKGEDLFFKGLTEFAPMFPLHAYRGQVAVWTSPPPSGRGNAIYLVIGYDKDQQLRLVGGNYFTEPKLQNSSALSGTAFFAKYDQADKRGQLQLIKDTVEASIQTEYASLVLNITRECEHFNTMAIYITALTYAGSMFHAGKAVIEGVRPSDISYEFFGEIK
jgi:hypothetical protein